MPDLLSIFFPNRCPYCREIIEFNRKECEQCRKKMPASPVFKTLPSGHRCVAPFLYDTQVRQAIIDMKFYGKTFNVRSLSERMADSVRELYGDEKISMLTAVPMMKKQKRMRGYNQSELLARELSGLIKLPYRILLKKSVMNRTQHELSGEMRAENVKGVYEAVSPELFRGKTILLTDDICTTGYTLDECCRVLIEAGAGKVLCAVAAITANNA